ncbi:hypothetical protein GCM10020358_36730 [Amorphoplanes nipponensis]|uniref:Uncharacterized protein n=1 Tax=Actinoplanes nipponensis TaxID=135950 RepID=A0A919JQZ0_9ACTN|nr:hypothetical protein [Actinoplanes nipponensis]GIE53845.1 hypothetical protein Ani05nite_73790 [Actinoplanes nipponensis]
MTATAPPTGARVSRVVVSGLLAAGWGADLFADVSDVWTTVVRFLLTTAGTAILVGELTAQAGRVAPGSTARWARSDTAIVAVLGGYAALLLAALIFGHPPGHQRTSGTAFIVLYVVLGGYYGWARGRVVARGPGAG